MINDKFSLVESDVRKFEQDGYLILRDFFSKEAIPYLNGLAEGDISAPTTNYGAGFSRLKYDVGNHDEKLLGLIQDDKFKNTLLKLTKRDLLFTQGIAFELEKNKSTGFPWHVGTQSFGFHKKEDFGCTLWVPFCVINPEQQKGGMAYLSKQHFSGEFVFQYINLIPEYLKLKAQDTKVDYAEFHKIKNDIINLPEISQMLDFYASEDYFSVGDAILFDKYVIHKSVRLEDGPINTRLAFALRFAETTSRYDAFRADQLEYPKHAFNYQGSSDFNIEVCQQDNQLITESPLYQDDLEKRLL